MLVAAAGSRLTGVRRSPGRATFPTYGTRRAADAHGYTAVVLTVELPDACVGLAAGGARGRHRPHARIRRFAGL